MPAVSVIMNCLNGEKVLPSAFRCLHEQTFQDYELIFFDNASGDATGDLARQFGQKLHYFRSGKTIPLGAARNEAIARANGRLIAFLDCDDLWKPDKLALQTKCFEADPAVGLVCTDTEVRCGGRLLYRMFERAAPARGNVFEALMLRQWVSMSSAMLSRAALDSIMEEDGRWFDQRLQVCEEADVFYRIAHDWKIDFVPEALTVWQIHNANSTFGNFAGFSSETRMILEKHRALYPGYDRQHAELVNVLEKRAAFQEAVSLWQSGNGRRARVLLRPYLASSPKFRLFNAATFLPGSLFPLLARAYFALPAVLRK